MNTTDPQRSGAPAGRLSLRPRDWPIVFFALLALALAILVIAAPWRAPDSPQARAAAFSVLGRNIDDVVLTNSAGEAVRWGALDGHPRAVFFGFTHCPEVCPTTMADISAAVERIGPAARDLRVDFISVDPERDTPQVLHDYFTGFGERFKGYSGARDQIDRLVRAFQATYQRTPLEGGDYTIDHTAIVYLLDRNGAVVDIVGYQTPPERLDAQLRGLLSRPETTSRVGDVPQEGGSS
ncbi:MAG: SCO family protein [Hyphomonadaceae bacterium]